MVMKNTKQRKEKENVWLNKQRKNFAKNHSHLDQEPFQTSFSNLAIKSRTIKKWKILSHKIHEKGKK